MFVRLLLALATLALAASTLAQQPAATTPGATLTHSCKKPEAHPGKLGSDTARRTWAQAANGYLECLKKFAMDQQAIGKPLIDQAKPHIEAANAAVEEYNKAAAALKEENEKNN